MNRSIARVQKTNSIFATFFLATLFVQSLAFASGSYPDGPDLTQTPGKLCETDAVKRYPEGISYCGRNVSSDTKNAIIQIYDQKFGFQISKMNRGDFKIDHFIPLSIGGSNSIENLWPQYRQVYEITDPIEQLLSNKIAAGRIKQVDAVRLIKVAKLNLSKADEITHLIEAM